MSFGKKSYSGEDLRNVLPQYKMVSEAKEGDLPQLYKSINSHTGIVYLIAHPMHWETVRSIKCSECDTKIRPAPRNMGKVEDLVRTGGSTVGSVDWGA